MPNINAPVKKGLPSQDVRCHCKANEEGSKLAPGPPIYSPHADHHGQEERHHHFSHSNSSYISVTTDSSERGSGCITEFNRWGDGLEKTKNMNYGKDYWRRQHAYQL